MVIKKKLLVWILLLSSVNVQTTYSMDNKYIGWGLSVGAGICFAACVYTCGTGIVIRSMETTKQYKTTRESSNECFRTSAMWLVGGAGFASTYFFLSRKPLPALQLMPEL
jgi:hypothetical protein